jgi:hypothetical protein
MLIVVMGWFRASVSSKEILKLNEEHRKSGARSPSFGTTSVCAPANPWPGGMVRYPMNRKISDLTSAHLTLLG